MVVSLEEFFNGNHSKFSIAANVDIAPPFDTTEAWVNHLMGIRDNDAVHDVVVGITMIEPYEDGRIGMWPYSDTIWIYSSLDRESVAKLVAPLEPDEVRDALLDYPNWDLTPPISAPEGFKTYWIWWD